MRVLAAFAVLSQVCWAGLKIINPPQLAQDLGKEGVIQSSLANFGHITYGQTLIGKVIRPVENMNGCKPLTLGDFPDEFRPEPFPGIGGIPRFPRFPHGSFILLERGGCSNPTKVRNVESFGSQMALIGDEIDEDVTKVIMEDYDGSGFSLKIPAYMIENRAFKKIKAVLDAGKDVYLKAELIIARPDNSIDLGVFWGSSLDMTQYTVEAFSQMVAAHQENNTTDTLLSLHVHTFGCPTCPKEIKQTDCVSNGAYCTFFPRMGDISQEELDPEDYIVQQKNTAWQKIKTDFTGRDLLISSLFEKCAHQLITKVPGRTIYTEKDLIQSMLYRNAECNRQLELTSTYGKFCLAQNFDDPVLEPFIEEIMTCIGDSFEDDKDFESNNELLEADKQWGSQHNLISHPTILINDFTYRGDIDFKDLKQAICSAYKVRPEYCNIAAALEDAENIDTYVNASYAKKMTLVFGKFHFFVIGLLIVLCNVGLLLGIRRWNAKSQTERINTQVNAAVSQYFALQTSAD